MKISGCRGEHSRIWSALFLVIAVVSGFAHSARAQSPELAMRDFSSGQIKKGVRSIGFGGDGATWGNYGLVWQDANTAVLDYGDTRYTNGNDFNFQAVGATSPSLWHDLAIYAIAMTEGTNDVKFLAKAQGLGPTAVPMVGKGTDDAVFVKVAMPLAYGISAGVLLSHETSRLDATTATGQNVRYETDWRPSGGFGVAWQSDDKKWLFGFRALYNNDFERRIDSTGLAEGMAQSQEYRLGGSYQPWKGGLIDIGATRLEKWNAIAGTHTVAYNPNLGFEQKVTDSFTVRVGLDETSPTAGLTYRFSPFKLDIAYVHDMAKARVGDLFGTTSNSILATLTFDFTGHAAPTKSAGAGGGELPAAKVLR
ncbi:MAG: hypothetical protein ACXWKP_01730 [Bradyrhizobium sp.]